jgi:hypothetical protein
MENTVKTTVETGEPAIGISLDCKINDRRALVIQTYLPRDAANGAVYHLLEKCLHAADILEVRYRLKDLRLLLEKTLEELPIHERKAKDFQERAYIKHQQGNRRGEFKFSQAEQSSFDNMTTNVATCRENIKRFEKAIAEAEMELAHASTGATDNQSSAPDS